MTEPLVKVPFLNFHKYLDPNRWQSYEQVPTTHRKSEFIIRFLNSRDDSPREGGFHC